MVSKICILCRKEYTEHGNNPWPLANWQDGQCCDSCDKQVLAARIQRARMEDAERVASEKGLS